MSAVQYAWPVPMLQRLLLSLTVVVASILWPASSWAGSIFLTGHDPDSMQLSEETP